MLAEATSEERQQECRAEFLDNSVRDLQRQLDSSRMNIYCTNPGSQEQEPKCGLVHEKKRQPRKYENTSSSLLERNTSSGNPGLTMRVFDLVDLKKFKPKKLRNTSMGT